MIYLASPYSHDDDTVRQQRFESACRAAAELMRGGTVVLSPVAHGHVIAKHGLPSDWSFWQRFDLRHLQRCDAVVVLTLPGWQQSEGVTAESKLARELGKRVRYWRPKWARPGAIP